MNLLKIDPKPFINKTRQPHWANNKNWMSFKNEGFLPSTLWP